MKKCVKISFSIEQMDGFLHDFAQVQARKLSLEGVAQLYPPSMVKIVIVGANEAIETFIDLLHREAEERAIADIEIEPALKERDYRGIFRVIE